MKAENNEVWDTGVIFSKFLSWFEPLEGLVFVDAFEFQSDGVLPKCVPIGLVKFQSVLHIAWNFDTEHELDSIDAHFVSMYHRSHPYIILEEFSSPLPCGMFCQMFLDSIGDQGVRVLDL